jgi:hypothetical protein
MACTVVYEGEGVFIASRASALTVSDIHTNGVKRSSRSIE